MRRVLAAALVLSAWTSSEAGELVFANGSRVAGDLTSEGLMVSTGSGLVEIAPLGRRDSPAGWTRDPRDAGRWSGQGSDVSV